MLLLFDIDGTLLIAASDAHRAALHAAVEEVHGIRVAPDSVEVAGRTDAAITGDLARHAGVPEADVLAAQDAVAAAACRHYERLCPNDLSARVAPGVPQLLADLATEPAAEGGPRLALLTGNYAGIAHRKLGAAGIGPWFDDRQGAYGCDHHDRGRLPAVARRRAAVAGEDWPAERTVVIGDTPRDIACARAGGVHVVAITTGPYAAEDLVEADAVVESAAEIPAALAAIIP